MSNTTNNYKLMGFFEALSLIFVIAKIAGYITWSWWWVFAPVIAHVVFTIIVLLVIGIIAVVIKK